MEKVLVGPKNRHLPIPEGYRLITDVPMRKNDLCANLEEVKWERIDNEDVGQIVYYDHVIRNEA